VTCNKFEDTQLLGTTFQNSVNRRRIPRDLRTAVLNLQTKLLDCWSTYTLSATQQTCPKPQRKCRRKPTAQRWSSHPSSPKLRFCICVEFTHQQMNLFL